MRSVARDAAFDFHALMLIDEGPRFVGVTLEADSILRRSGADLPAQKSPVGIVAVVALHHAFIHSVMERAVELLLHFLVAAIAEHGGLFLHQELAFLRVVGRVAVRATDSVLEVSGAREVVMLFAILVALQAACADL